MAKQSFLITNGENDACSTSFKNLVKILKTLSVNKKL